MSTRHNRLRAIAEGLQVAAALCALAAMWIVFGPAMRSALGDRLAPAAVSRAHDVGISLPGHRNVSAERVVLVVDSTPAGAQVQVDGERHGRTPAIVELSCEHATWQVRVVKEGFGPWSKKVDCHTHAEVKIHAELVRLR
jgi:hypothetical protein